MRSSGKFATIFAITVSLCLFGSQFSLAKSKKEKEEIEKPVIEVEKIAPEEVPTVQGRTYDEGITIKEIQIVGNNLVKEEDILKNLSTKQGGKFDRDNLQKDLKSIYDMGYFTENLKIIPKAESTGIKLRIEVQENTPVTGFNITGNTVINSEELAGIFNKQTGLPQNIAELNKTVEEIEKFYSDKGYILTRVKKIADDPDGMINIEINEGVIGDIKISGNKKTKDFVIKRNMITAKDTIYNENLLKQDLKRLFGTQAFSDVRRVISVSPENPDKYLLTVEVDEKRTGSISLGGGIDTGSGLFGSLGYTDPNFRGAGQELSTTFMSGSGYVLRDSDMVRKPTFQFEANFVEPRLKQSLNSLAVSAYGRDYASYQVPLGIERRIGGSVEFARPIKRVPHLAGSVSLGFENVGIREGDDNRIAKIYSDAGVNIARRAEQLEGGTYLSLGPKLVFDTRNSTMNTREGWYASLGLGENLAIAGDAGSYGTVNATVRKFIPVGEKSTFSFGGKIGAKTIGEMPEFAAFRLGGAYSIRGFREGDVGNGQGFMMTTAEYRTPIPYIEKLTSIKFIQDIRTAFFVDAGSVFKQTVTNDLFNRPGYGITVGSGLLVTIPGLGPVRVDYGYPLTAVGAGNQKGRFTFGFGERY